MISRSLFAAVLLASSAPAAPPLTTIQDVLYKADGKRFAGTLTISWTSFESIDQSAIMTQTTTVTVTNGQLFVRLVPTTTAVPAASYTVKYNSDGYIQFSETWAVPSSTTPLRVRDVRIGTSQAGTIGSDTGGTPIQESDVVGLIPDLGARPLKGPGYAPGRVAIVNPTGSLESATGSPEDCVRVDGSSGPCGGSQPAFVDGESPSGTMDGSNNTFTLSSVPDPVSSLTVHLNGVLQKAGQDYNISGNSVIFVAAAVPHPGDTLTADYRIQGSATLLAPPSVLSPQQIDHAGLTAGQSWLWNGSSYVAGNVLESTGNYSNPAWIASLAYAKITGVPSFEPAIPAGTAGQYWRGDKSWQALNAAAVANAADTTGSYSDPVWLSISKGKVGLSNVENTALSTWAGSSSLTTIGTLAAGTVPWARLSGVPPTFTPTSHASTHEAAGSDPLTAAAIGAVASSGGNQPNGYVALDGSGRASIGTTVVDPALGLTAAQTAEQATLPLIHWQPKTAGSAPFQTHMQSFPNTGAGAGTYNHGVFTGFNAGLHSGGTLVAGTPSIFMGFEDGYYDGADVGKEWYIEGWSPDGTAVQMSRPYYARGSQGDDGTDWWTVLSNIGASGPNRQFSVLAGATHLLDLVPGRVTLGATTNINGSAILNQALYFTKNLTDSGARRNWAVATEYDNVGDFVVQVSPSNTSTPSVTKLELSSAGQMTLPSYAGSGNAYACFDSAGKLYRSATECN